MFNFIFILTVCKGWEKKLTSMKLNSIEFWLELDWIIIYHIVPIPARKISHVLLCCLLPLLSVSAKSRNGAELISELDLTKACQKSKLFMPLLTENQLKIYFHILKLLLRCFSCVIFSIVKCILLHTSKFEENLNIQYSILELKKCIHFDSMLG